MFSMIMFNNINLSTVFCVSVIINFIAAGVLGFAIPTLLNSIKIDPAASSGVLLTALTDWIGFFTFLSIAYLFLI